MTCPECHGVTDHKMDCGRRVGTMTKEAALAHARYKRDAGEMRAKVADRLIASLEAAPDGRVDYMAHFLDASFPAPPARLYHTAPRSARDSILAEGLKVSQPGQGGSWVANKAVCEMLQGTQPPGVYCGALPDTDGVWSHWPEWDVWEVRRGEVEWTHDELNPGCYRLSTDITPDRIRLLS